MDINHITLPICIFALCSACGTGISSAQSLHGFEVGLIRPVPSKVLRSALFLPESGLIGVSGHVVSGEIKEKKLGFVIGGTVSLWKIHVL